MIHSLECKHFTKSLFRVDLLDNKVLLWCVVVLSLMTFPVVYIPRINDDVFLVGSLTWEWGIVVSGTGGFAPTFLTISPIRATAQSRFPLASAWRLRLRVRIRVDVADGSA